MYRLVYKTQMKRSCVYRTAFRAEEITATPVKFISVLTFYSNQFVTLGSNRLPQFRAPEGSM